MCSVLNIRNVPSELMAKLKADAARDGRTLRMHVLRIIRKATEEKTKSEATK